MVGRFDKGVSLRGHGVVVWVQGYYRPPCGRVNQPRFIIVVRQTPTLAPFFEARQRERPGQRYAREGAPLLGRKSLWDKPRRTRAPIVSEVDGRSPVVSAKRARSAAMASASGWSATSVNFVCVVRACMCVTPSSRRRGTSRATAYDSPPVAACRLHGCAPSGCARGRPAFAGHDASARPTAMASGR